jgi:hypothetical protein
VRRRVALKPSEAIIVATATPDPRFQQGVSAPATAARLAKVAPIFSTVLPKLMTITAELGLALANFFAGLTHAFLVACAVFPAQLATIFTKFTFVSVLLTAIVPYIGTVPSEFAAFRRREVIIARMSLPVLLTAVLAQLTVVTV